MGTPISVAPQAASVASSSVLVSGRYERWNSCAKLSVERPKCSTGPLNCMNEITTTAANGTIAAPTTIQQ